MRVAWHDRSSSAIALWCGNQMLSVKAFQLPRLHVDEREWLVGPRASAYGLVQYRERKSEGSSRGEVYAHGKDCTGVHGRPGPDCQVVKRQFVTLRTYQ